MADIDEGLRVLAFAVGLVLIGIGLKMVFADDIITKIEGILIAPTLIVGGVYIIIEVVRKK